MRFIEASFYFYCYAFLGWCVEVAFAALRYGRFVNRGFLNGAWCPIYGCGMTLVVSLLQPLQQNSLALFVGSAAVTTLLEYLTGIILERLFQTRWWDYSDMPFNIGGHVCALFSVLWGLACTFVIRIIHPMIDRIYSQIPEPVLTAILAIATVLLIADSIATFATARQLSLRLQRIDHIAAELHRLSDSLGQSIFDTVTDIGQHADHARGDLHTLAADIRERHVEYHRKLQLLSDTLRRSAAEKRMLNAFPDMKSARYSQALERLKEYHRRRKQE